MLRSSQSLLIKPVIAVDIDEVLAPFVRYLAAYHNKQYGTNLSISDFHSYEFHQVWGGTFEEGSKKVRDFFESDDIQHIPIMPYSVNILRKLSRDFTLHVVTARANYAEAVTSKFIFKHFDNIFTDIHFGNHYAVDGHPISKADICKRIGAVMLIDDSLKYAKICANEGVPVILFGEYPWNRPHTHDYDEFMIPSSLLLSSSSSLQDDKQRKWMIREAKDWKSVYDMVYDRLDLKPSTLEQRFMMAAVQMTSTNDQQANLATIDRLVATAAENGADIICLPECCTYMAYNRSELYDVSEAIAINSTSYAMTALSSIAQKHACWLSIGGFPERHDDIGEKVYNTHFLINPSGSIIDPVYRKIHLFDNPLTKLEESSITAAGDEHVVLDIGFVRLGLTVCYDLRFPELYATICTSPVHSSGGEVDTSIIGGAEVVLVPSAFTVPTGRAHWEILLRARAIENQVYIVAAAQSGKHSDKRESYGHTMIIDPWGNIVDECVVEGEGICYAEFDRSHMESVRKIMPVWSHRRYDTYKRR